MNSRCSDPHWRRHSSLTSAWDNVLLDARDKELLHHFVHPGCCRVFCSRLMPPDSTKVILLLKVKIKIPFPEVRSPPQTWAASTPRGALRETYSHLVMTFIALLCFQVSLSAVFEAQRIRGGPTTEVQTFIRAWSLVRQVRVFSRGFASLTKWCLLHNCSIPLSRKIKPRCEKRNPIALHWNDSGSLLDQWSSPRCFPFFSVCKRLCDFFF